MNTWPALSTHLDGSWVIRAAKDFTGRANSVTCLDPSDSTHLGARIEAVEAFYTGLNQVPTFRATPLMPRALYQELEQRGYDAGTKTLVLGGPMPTRADANSRLWRDVQSRYQTNGHEVHIQTHIPFTEPPQTWLETLFSLNQRAARHADVFKRMIGVLSVPAACLSLGSSDHTTANPGALGNAALLAAVNRDWLTVHLVGTRADMRRRGYARALMAAALAWGHSVGVRQLWICVVADNKSAIALYRSLGLSTAFHYGYLRRYES